jgi:hypothetical protein
VGFILINTSAQGIQFLRLAVLRSENSAIAQRQESSRDRGSYAGFPALRSIYPFWTKTSASEALASSGGTGWYFGEPAFCVVILLQIQNRIESTELICGNPFTFGDMLCDLPLVRVRHASVA